jgi:hypothetical protein
LTGLDRERRRADGVEVLLVGPVELLGGGHST